MDVVKLQLAAGAKANVGGFGLSPLSLAEHLKCKPLIEVLKAAENKTTKPKKSGNR